VCREWESVGAAANWLGKHAALANWLGKHAALANWLGKHAALATCLDQATGDSPYRMIIGYIRRLALGSPLVPYAERVDRALQRLRQKHQFTKPQRKWLDRNGTQMKHETVVDKQSVDQGRLKTDGGFIRLNKVFDGKLESLLGELADEVWVDAG